MKPGLLNDLDQASNATQESSAPKQIAAMNAGLQRSAEINATIGSVVDAQPQPLQPSPYSVPPAISTPSNLGALPPPWGPWTA